MKLTNFAVSSILSTTVNTGPTSEKRDAREARMKAFWADPKNAKIVVMGKVLASAHAGKTLAQHLVDGAEFEMDSINGLPLTDGFKLSLKTLNLWGCPACRSAHGSGVYPSREVDADLLMECKFFYNPVTKLLFTISTTCWSSYVKALGVATDQRFVQQTSVKAEAKPANAPKPQAVPTTK